MKHLLKYKIFLISIIIAFILCGYSDKSNNTYPVLLISIDGMRPDYISRFDTPNLHQLISDGVLADWMIPVFPSKTFPNHYSLITGLYPEHTGVIANNMYDSSMNAWFSLGDRDAVTNSKWYGGEPVWITAEKQGIKSGLVFWPGSEAAIEGMYASHWLTYNDSLSYTARVDTIIKWLQPGENLSPKFLTLYFNIVDNYGHKYGPESDSIGTAMHSIDQVIGYLTNELKRAGLSDKINILITSDHGMAQISSDRVILLDKIIDLKNVDMYDWTPVAMIQPKKGKKEEIYDSLKKAENHYKVYKKEDIPEHYKLKNSNRVPDIIVVADVGYTITTSAKSKHVSGGTHGYDNNDPSMRAFFLAYGPSFKKGEQVKAFQNIHVYDLICKLLNINPAPNDGSIDSLKQILR